MFEWMLIDKVAFVGVFSACSHARLVERGLHFFASMESACKVHRNTEFVKWATDRLFSMQPEKSLNYKLMSNVYAALGLGTMWRG